MTTIGKRISRIRKAQNMSQSTLAQDICSQSNISKIEKGEHIPSFFILSLFAERLNVSRIIYIEDQINLISVNLAG